MQSDALSNLKPRLRRPVRIARIPHRLSLTHATK
jgi:hypothetical protein